jgi:cytochrome P450
MSDPQTLMMEGMMRSIECTQRAFGDPESVAARTSDAPQSMYLERSASEPVKDLGNGFFSVVRMDDIVHLTRSRGVLQGSEYLGSDRPAIPLGLDGPRHLKFRRLMDPAFTLKRVTPLATNIRQLANELIDRFEDEGKVDAYSAWCEPLPSTIFLSIMGLPMDRLEDFLHFKDLTLGSGPMANATIEEKFAGRGEGVAWIHDYFNRDLDRREKEAEHGDDMIGWLLASEVDGDRLTREELLDILGLLMIAGLDTVTASLSCFLSFLARHPEQRAKIVAKPEIIPSAVEEMMRFESPVSEGYRRVEEDLDLPSGTTIPAGSFVHVSWSAANLDPNFFDDPMRVDLERSPNRHIGFASGFHRCLGSHLARVELQTAMSVWHERIPDYRVEDGTELSYSVNPRAPHKLPLVWKD